MKHINSTIDLTSWELDKADTYKWLFEKAVKETASEALELAFNDPETDAYLPYIMSHHRVDPLTIDFKVALNGTAIGPDPVWRTTLWEMVSKTITKASGNRDKELKVVQSALIALVKRIDYELLSSTDPDSQP